MCISEMYAARGTASFDAHPESFAWLRTGSARDLLPRLRVWWESSREGRGFDGRLPCHGLRSSATPPIQTAELDRTPPASSADFPPPHPLRSAFGAQPSSAVRPTPVADAWPGFGMFGNLISDSPEQPPRRLLDNPSDLQSA
jgi:hypothetical protein